MLTSKHIWYVLASLAVISLFLFLWGSRYIYFVDGREESSNAVLWRVNRFTGDIQASTPVLRVGEQGGLSRDIWLKGL